MGCDVHMFTERKNRKDKWVSADNFTMDVEFEDAYTTELVKDMGRIEICSDRNYTLFGVLAGVRRDYDNHLPIRGIPNDASELVKREYKVWECDAHTATWATVTELEQHQRQTDSHQLHLMLEDLEQHFKSRWNFIVYDDNYKNNCRIIFWFDN